MGQAPAADPEPSPEVVDVGDETDELLGSLSGELSGKPREVLNYLAKRRRRSVSIDELRREVWRDASGIVDEHDTKAVRTAVSALRTELRRLDRAALAEQIRWNGTGYTLS